MDQTALPVRIARSTLGLDVAGVDAAATKEQALFIDGVLALINGKTTTVYDPTTSMN